MIERIFLDVDGVLNHFSTYVLNRLGAPIEVGQYDKYPVQCEDIVDAYAVLTGTRISKTAFWSQITQDMWAMCPRSEEFLFLIERSLRIVGRDNVFILTAPTLDPLCVAGKVQWLQAHLPRELQRNFLIGPHKHICAKPGHLLVDDFDKNVNAFRAEGGQALLVPRPWNSDFHVNTALRLTDAFVRYEKLQNEK